MNKLFLYVKIYFFNLIKNEDSIFNYIIRFSINKLRYVHMLKNKTRNGTSKLQFI
jgi:hypothetical protein